MSTTNGMTPALTSNGAGSQNEIGQIRPTDIVGEMQVAYLDYAMSVIVARALPDVRDGLKPVHRRILYAMYADLGLTHDKPHKKSARVVGEVLGKYHPHGDVAVYDAMVRMAQDFSLRYPLIDGQGNFGSIDGDSPAAMRYTEARLAEISDLMLTDLDKETVGWHDNFDNTLLEPDVLPAALPNLLINGSNGIAVGMATNIPPHNLGEVVDALAYLIDHYAKVEEITVEQLMRFIQGPDFPTGGIIYRYREDDKSEEQVDAIAQGYAVGKSRLVLQAKAHFEEMSRGRSRIVITELPYQTNKTTLIERIADLVRDGKLEGIADLRDESDRTGMRVMIELKRDVEPKSVLADLFKYTPLQQTFGMQMLALSEGQPRMLSLKRMLHLFVQHREEVIRRRSEFELKRARERAHIVEGLLKALDILDEVIHTIRHSQTVDTARRNLVANFKFTEIQAQAILDMQLRRLAALERKKLQDEFKELRDRIAYLEDLLAHPEKILAVIKAELLAIKEKYGDARRTQIVDRTKGTLTTTDLIPEQAVWIGIGANGELRRQEVGKLNFTALRQLGKGSDVAVLTANTRDALYLFTQDGRSAKVAIHELPADGSSKSAAELCKLNPRDRLSAALTLPAALAAPKESDDKAYLFLVTEQGMVKRITLADFLAAVINTPTVMGVDEKDRLGWVCLTQGNQEVLLVTAEGQAIRFNEAEVRSMGLAAAGVGGIKLKKGDKVVYATVVEPTGELITLTAHGFTKRSILTDYPSQGRNGGGIVTHKLSERTGNVVTALLVNHASAGEMILTITRKGNAKPIALAEIPVMGRGVLGKAVIEGTAQEAIVKLLRVQSNAPNGSVAASNDDNPTTTDKSTVEASKDKVGRTATPLLSPPVAGAQSVAKPVTNGGVNGKPVVDQPSKPAPERPPLTAPVAKPMLAASSPRKTVVADPSPEQVKVTAVKAESSPPVVKTELTKPSPATVKATPIVDTQKPKNVTTPAKPASTGAEVVQAVPAAPRADALSNFVAEKLSGKAKPSGRSESAMPTANKEPQHPPIEERPVQTSLFGVDLSPRTPGASTTKAKKVETVVSVPASQASKSKKK